MSYFYIYKMTHPETGEFYIGRRTSAKKPVEDVNYRGSSYKWYRNLDDLTINEILIKEILVENIESQEELNEIEIKWITENLENPLCKNAHIPGKGFYTTGPRSEETKKKLSEHFTGRPNPNYPKTLSDEARKNISEGAKGKIISEETKKKLSIAGSKRILTEEHRLNISKSWEERRKKGVSEETRNKISESKKGTLLTNEHKIKISESVKGENNSFFGKTHNEETKKKISEKMKGKTRAPFSEETKAKMAEAARNRKNKKST